MAYYIKTKLEDGTVQELTCEENNYDYIDFCFANRSGKISNDGVELTVKRCDGNYISDESDSWFFEEHYFPKLKKLTMESGFGEGTFLQNNNLEELVFGENVVDIWKRTWRAPKLKTLTFMRPTPASGYTIFSDTYTNDINPEVIYVPKGSEVAYASFSPWFQERANIIKALPEEPTVIDHITVGGTNYEIADTKARADIEALKTGEVDAYTKGETDNLLKGKQDKINGDYVKEVEIGGGYITFKSMKFDGNNNGTYTANFKTINGQPILGTGNIDVDTSRFVTNIEFENRLNYVTLQVMTQDKYDSLAVINKLDKNTLYIING